MVLIFQIVLVICYFSLCIELTFLHVPSVASSLNIWNPENNILKFYSEKYKRWFGYPKWLKALLFVLPVLLLSVYYCLPLLEVFGVLKLSRVFTVQPLGYVLAIAFMILGRLVTLSSVITIRKSNRQEGDSFRLHNGGLFSKIRNPIQTGLYIFFIAVCIGIPNIVLMMGLPLYMIYMHNKVKMEEDFLTNKFGASYSSYFSKTRRYI